MLVSKSKNSEVFPTLFVHFKPTIVRYISGTKTVEES